MSSSRKQLTVAIIGTGSAALAAVREVKKVTDDFIIVSNGIYGTTCIRAGCMPSVSLIETAQLLHQQHLLAKCGITAENIVIDTAKTLEYVRSMREHFLGSVLDETESYRPHIIEGKVWFHSPTIMEVNGIHYQCGSVILATGSRPVIPEGLKAYKDYILTSDNLFDQKSLPKNIAVWGLDLLGTEMAQAFARLGSCVTAFTNAQTIGGLTDQAVSDRVIKELRKEMDVRLGEYPDIALKDNKLYVGDVVVDKMFLALGRKANLEGMGLEACGLIDKGDCIQEFNEFTMQVRDLRFFVAGDVKPGRSLLHNAVDEGKIAGHNACIETPKTFKRRTTLQIAHTHPAIAIAGKILESLAADDIVTGEAVFENQGRATLIGMASGIIHIYVDKKTRIIQGAELLAPDGEHIAHLLAWLADRQVTVDDALHLPFYHPSTEECIRSALKDAARKLREM